VRKHQFQNFCSEEGNNFLKPWSIGIRAQRPRQPAYDRRSLPVEIAIRDGVFETSSSESEEETPIILSTLKMARGTVNKDEARPIRPWPGTIESRPKVRKEPDPASGKNNSIDIGMIANDLALSSDSDENQPSTSTGIRGPSKYMQQKWLKGVSPGKTRSSGTEPPLGPEPESEDTPITRTPSPIKISCSEKH